MAHDNITPINLDAALIGRARQVLLDEDKITELSMGERIAIALVLDRADLFPRDTTMLEAFNRLGHEWTSAALRVQRKGFQCEEMAHG